MTLFKDKANLIWEVADLLRGDYRQSDYGKVILPLTISWKNNSPIVHFLDKTYKKASS